MLFKQAGNLTGIIDYQLHKMWSVERQKRAAFGKKTESREFIAVRGQRMRGDKRKVRQRCQA